MQPQVTIGMPLYNAEKTLRRAIDSVLSQDYPHFELIISDNGSTDGTEGICRAFTRKDERITYVRQPGNRGAHWNFNQVVGFAKGKYFMRMSHDDVRAPTYVSKCVALLEANPGAVLCHSYTAAFYDDDLSNVVCIITQDTLIGVRSARKRFLCALKHFSASAIDGVFLTEALRNKARLLDESYFSSDIVLTNELALYGEFVQVPEVLFWRSGKNVLPAPKDSLAIYTPHVKPTLRFTLPFLVLALDHLRSIRRSPLTVLDKGILALQVIAHECKIGLVKVGFRSVTGALGDRCPLWFLRAAIAMARNPNLRMLRPPRDLPPALHPTWRLLNHRNMDRALVLQQQLDAKLYPSQV
jgi:glycosyltransferase involved in cell wall biosynthesis